MEFDESNLWVMVGEVEGRVRARDGSSGGEGMRHVQACEVQRQTDGETVVDTVLRKGPLRWSSTYPEV